MNSARAGSKAAEGNSLDTQKRLASWPFLTAAASCGHSQSARPILTFSLRWSHVTEKETKAQRIEATHPMSHRRDLGFEPRSDPRGEDLTHVLVDTAQCGCLTTAAWSSADSEHLGRT